MKRLVAMVVAIVGCLGILLLQTSAYAASATAYDPNAGVDCSQAQAAQSAFCASKSDGSSNPLSSNNGLLFGIADIVAYAAGIAAVIIIIISGIRYITAGGDANSAASARRSLVGAIIGLAIIALAYTLINYVVGSTN